ncbi:MAG: acetyl-CoA carboxylase biotin carboxylase subunit [Polyangiaceae bacterium]|nr:acetyl-CoA carboxylase biotin carboxylase subunit [Polyangiaceae bacterium]
MLIANRGEIAVRITRTLREMGIRSVAVFSDADRAALHVRTADEAIHVGPSIARESYLNVERILDAAKKSGADAIHPGYGFLSENADFREACDRAGVTFIGPPATAMRAMGSKTAARAKMAEAGVPITPGGNATSLDEARATAERVGYPVMLKAAMGGGGKGMRLVHGPDELASALERAQSEALRAFGDGTVYIEKAIIRPRHVEIQVLGDRDGNLVHLFERDCSIQRRHQKVVEETPCPVASPELIAKMGEVAVRGALSVGYFSAGTFEFLLAPDGSFYFLEMNTRLQVEHPITEWVTGFDLVREMVHIAAGERRDYQQQAIVRRGASIECRVYAEDPRSGFLPSPGKITALRAPSGAWVRDDGGYYAGAEVPSDYDPQVAKLSVWAPTREIALSRMRRALGEYVVTGIATNLAFHQKLMSHAAFCDGQYDTGFIEQHKADLLGYADVPEEDEGALAAAIALAVHRESSEPRFESAPSVESMSPWLQQHRARMMAR